MGRRVQQRGAEHTSDCTLFVHATSLSFIIKHNWNGERGHIDQHHCISSRNSEEGGRGEGVRGWATTVHRSTTKWMANVWCFCVDHKLLLDEKRFLDADHQRVRDAAINRFVNIIPSFFAYRPPQWQTKQWMAAASLL